MKRKMFFRLTAVCLMAVSVLIACTKDYGSDIKKLQDDMSKLSAQVDKLQKCIDDGCVITDVTPIENGVKVTLSNGKDPFYIYNGKDGKDGEDGDDGKDGKDGTVWKIGDNGNWWSSTEGQPFVDTNMPARGPKGDEGKDGKSAYEVAKANGFAGSEQEWLDSLKGDKGDKGDTGDYYYPCCDKESENYGKWIKVDGATGEPAPTDLLWLPEGTLTAVWDDENQVLEIHNVEGADDGIVRISLATDLKSIALIPEMWDADLGMPTAKVYAILPTAWETMKNLWAKTGVYPRFRDILWPGSTYANPVAFRMYLWLVLYNSYLGKTGQTESQEYDATFDCTSASFRYWDRDKNANPNSGGYETTYDNFVAAIDDLLTDWENAFRASFGAEPWNTSRIPPVSALNLKYRINPAGTDLSGYKLNMIDRSMTVVGGTKADGDHRSSAVPVMKTNYHGDQLDVEAYIHYYKYWADKPAEWFLRMLTTREAATWNYWNAFSGRGDIPNAYTLQETADFVGKFINDASLNPFLNGSPFEDFNFVGPNVRAMRDWLSANDLGYETILALEASRGGMGAEAIVSDYTSVQIEYVTPIWTAYQHRYREAPYDDNCATTELWPMACNLLSMEASDTEEYENDYLMVGKTYDVASHMRFADPYYGKLENLGFEVDYKYYIFCKKNDGGKDAGGNGNYYTSGKWYEDEWQGGHGESAWNYGAWDKIECTADGKVTVKADAVGAIGKYVMIVADATIKNKATGTDYTSSVGAGLSGWSWDPKRNLVPEELFDVMFDEFAGHYVLLIIPDSTTAVNVEHDLGTFDYLELSSTATAPLSKAYEAVDMDLDGFLRIYGEPSLTSASKPGVTITYDNGFTAVIDNSVALGNGSVMYTFEPKEEFAGKYPNICYTIKWNVTINWAETEPILHEDYILYDDNPTNTKLTKTIINPDPATLDAWKDYRTVSTDLTKVPYVDSIVSVKGKKVGDGWKPQSSIKEHIHDYGQYLDLQENIADLSMSIDWANTKNSAGQQLATTSAEIITPDGAMAPTYKLQEILMKENFKAYEQYRDYLINITVKLKNGTSKVVKAYIVRFINPFKLQVTDVELHTHREDWCAKRANILLLDAQSGATVYNFQTNVIDASYRDLYPGILEAIQDEANRPTWKIAEPLDPSFGEPGEFLRVDPTTGWFYWRNAGTNLQNDKTTTYEVRMNLPALAELADTGEITVLNVDHSYVFHKECDPNDPTPQPNENGRPIWEVVFE